MLSLFQLNNEQSLNYNIAGLENLFLWGESKNDSFLKLTLGGSLPKKKLKTKEKSSRGKNFQILMSSKKKKSFDLGSHFFIQNSWSPLKKKSFHFDFICDFPIFLPKSRCFPKKKKKKSSPEISLRLPDFCPEIIVTSKI